MKYSHIIVLGILSNNIHAFGNEPPITLPPIVAEPCTTCTLTPTIKPVQPPPPVQKPIIIKPVPVTPNI